MTTVIMNTTKALKLRKVDIFEKISNIFLNKLILNIMSAKKILDL